MFRSPKDTIRVPEKEVIDPKKCYNCDICDAGGWTSEADVDIHRKKVHKMKLLTLLKNGEHMCTVCVRQQNSSSDLIKHVKTNHLFTPANSSCVEREIFICDICNHMFFNKKLLIAHLQHSHAHQLNRKTVRIECPKCFKMIKFRAFWLHLIYHDALTVSTCPICLEFFENKERMMQHIRSHKGYYYCSICNDTITREKLFNNHLMRHHRTNSMDVKKNQQKVSKYFLPGKNFNKIIPKISNILKGIPMASVIQVCVMCRAMCVSKEEMRRHIFEEHAPEREAKQKTLMCACGEVFLISVLLKHHVFKLKGNHRALEENEIPNQLDDNCSSVMGIFESEQIVNEGLDVTSDSDSSP